MRCGALRRRFSIPSAATISLTLLCVTPESAHYWDGNESPWGLLKKFGKAVLLREASDLGSSRQLDLTRAPVVPPHARGGSAQT